MQPRGNSEEGGLFREASPGVYRSCKQTKSAAETSCQFLFADTKGWSIIVHIDFEVNYQSVLLLVMFLSLVASNSRARISFRNCYDPVMRWFYHRGVLRAMCVRLPKDSILSCL